MKTDTKTKTGQTRRKPALQPVARQAPVEPPPSQVMVAQRAYEIWQRHGCPSDTAFHDWLAAEAELRSHR